MGYFIIPVVVLILYALASLELMAKEIESPFSTDSNDLPIDQVCHNIRRHVGELLSQNAFLLMHEAPAFIKLYIGAASETGIRILNHPF
jgi:predicted membrane chloride channel (bestrophin family)